MSWAKLCWKVLLNLAGLIHFSVVFCQFARWPCSGAGWLLTGKQDDWGLRLSLPSRLVWASSHGGEGGNQEAPHVYTPRASAEVVCVTNPSAKASHVFCPDAWGEHLLKEVAANSHRKEAQIQERGESVAICAITTCVQSKTSTLKKGTQIVD